LQRLISVCGIASVAIGLGFLSAGGAARRLVQVVGLLGVALVAVAKIMLVARGLRMGVSFGCLQWTTAAGVV